MHQRRTLLLFMALSLLAGNRAMLADGDPRFNPVGRPGLTIADSGSREKPPVVQEVEGRPRMGIFSKDSPGGGIEITGVVPSGPADQAGLRSGDILVKFDGQPFATRAEYAAVLDNIQSSQMVEVTFRRLGQEMSAKVKFSANEGESRVAWEAGLRPGDVILSYGGQPTPTAHDYDLIKEGYAAGETVEVKYRRGSEERATAFKPAFWPGEEDGSAAFKLNPGGSHGSPIRGVVLSPARREAITYDQDGVFIVWTVDEMKPKKRFIVPGGFGTVERVSLARDGRMLGLICNYGVRRSAFVLDLDRLDIAAFLPIPENRSDFKFTEIAVAPDSSTALCVQNLWDSKTLPEGETRLFLFDLAGAGLLEESAPAGVKKPVFLSGQRLLATPGAGTNPVYQGQPGVIALGVSDGTVRQWSVTRNADKSLLAESTKTFSVLRDLHPIREQASVLSPGEVVAPRDHPWRIVIQSWLQPWALAGSDDGHLIVKTGRPSDSNIFRLSPSLQVTHWQMEGPRELDYGKGHEVEAKLGISPSRGYRLECTADGLWYGINRMSFTKVVNLGGRFTSRCAITVLPKVDMSAVAVSTSVDQSLDPYALIERGFERFPTPTKIEPLLAPKEWSVLREALEEAHGQQEKGQPGVKIGISKKYGESLDRMQVLLKSKGSSLPSWRKSEDVYSAILGIRGEFVRLTVAAYMRGRAGVFGESFEKVKYPSETDVRFNLSDREWDDGFTPMLSPLADSEIVAVESNLREIILARADLSEGPLKDDRLTGELVGSSRKSGDGAALLDVYRLELSDDESILAIRGRPTKEEVVNGGDFFPPEIRDLMHCSKFESGKALKTLSGKPPQTTLELAQAYEKAHASFNDRLLTGANVTFLQIGPTLVRRPDKPDKTFYFNRRVFGEDLIFEINAGLWSNEPAKHLQDLDDLHSFSVGPILLKVDSRPSELLALIGRAAEKRSAMLAAKTKAEAIRRSQELKMLSDEIEKRSGSHEVNMSKWKALLPQLQQLSSDDGVIGKINVAAEPCWILNCDSVGSDPDQGKSQRGIWRTSLNGDGGKLLVHTGNAYVIPVASKDGSRLFVFDPKSRRIDLYGTLTPQYLASAYVFEGGNWVWWTPAGFFSASDRAMEWIGWSSNQGLGHPARYFTGEQMFGHFQRPDIVQEVIQKGTPASQIAERLGLKFELSAVLRGVPMVELIGIKDGGKVGTPALSIQVKATEMGGGIHNLEFFHNGKRQVPDGPAIRGERDQTRSFTVNFQPGKNELRAVAYNGDKIMSTPATAVVAYDGAAATSTLHVLSVGVNRYQNARYNLNYCVADSDALLAALDARGRGIFKDIQQHRVIDEQATRSNIQAEFQRIAASAEPHDMFVFVFAGHGVMSETPESKEPIFHLVTHDVTRLYGDAEQLAEKAISAKQLEEWSAAIKAQKQLMLLDTCQSGGLVDTYAMRGAAEEKAIAQLSRATGTTVIASTGTEQYASEMKELGHGIFTYAILQALEKGAGDGNKDGRITVKELEAYVNDVVPELTLKHKGTAQYPNSYSRGQDFPIGTVK